jgi:hypothetical protein
VGFFLPFGALPSRKDGYKSPAARGKTKQAKAATGRSSTPGMGSQQDEGGAAAEVVYLHGVLEVTVFEAEHLHNAIYGRIMEVNLTERTALRTCTPLFFIFFFLLGRVAAQNDRTVASLCCTVVSCVSVCFALMHGLLAS